MCSIDSVGSAYIKLLDLLLLIFPESMLLVVRGGAVLFENSTPDVALVGESSDEASLAGVSVRDGEVETFRSRERYTCSSTLDIVRRQADSKSSKSGDDAAWI